MNTLIDIINKLIFKYEEQEYVNNVPHATDIENRLRNEGYAKAEVLRELLIKIEEREGAADDRP